MEFLADTCRISNPPDILARDPRGETYVEVKRIVEDSVIDDEIVEKLRIYLKDPNRPFCVSVYLKRTLSMPVMSNSDRDAKKRKAQDTLKEFKDKFEKHKNPPYH